MIRFLIMTSNRVVSCALLAFLAASGAARAQHKAAVALPKATPTRPIPTASPAPVTHTWDPPRGSIAPLPANDTHKTCKFDLFAGSRTPASNLHAAYTAEKAFLGERDRFGSPVEVGFSPEPNVGAYCWKYTFTILSKSEFFVAATPFRFWDGMPIQGPSLCVAQSQSLTGRPNGQIGIDASGGPINDVGRCRSLPPYAPPPQQFPTSTPVPRKVVAPAVH